jgi:hypothetical protein
MSPEMWWALGIYEGEGSISRNISPRRDRALGSLRSGVYVRVKMTDLDVIERLKKVTGIGHVRGPSKHPRQSGWKPFWVWSVSRRGDIRWLMRQWYPYLSARRQGQVDAALGEGWAAQTELAFLSD